MRVRPEYNFRIIGKNLRRLRKARGFSVEEVRAYMQLGSVQAIYKWERGEGMPQADSLLALMQLYNVHHFEALTEGSIELPSSVFCNKNCVIPFKQAV